MRIFIPVCVWLLLHSVASYSQPSPRDTVHVNHTVAPVDYFHSKLSGPQFDSATTLAFARLTQDVGFYHDSKVAYRTYLDRCPGDAEARIDYALLLCNDSVDRLLAPYEADTAVSVNTRDLKVLAGNLMVALMVLDSDEAGDLKHLRSRTEDAAHMLKRSADGHDAYLTWLADSTLRDLEHYDDNTADMIRDAWAEYDKTDNELNTIYKSILQNYRGDPVFIDYFKEAERAWLTYRDAEMLAIYPPQTSDSDDDHLYGSIQPVCEAGELRELEQTRIKELKNWSEGYFEGDLCMGSRKSKSEVEEIRSKQRYRQEKKK